MTISAVSMALVGILCEFFPHGILQSFSVESSGILPLFVQIMGAMFLGFAMLNWTAKTVLIGGIYARPLAIGNFFHFSVGALALLKFAFSAPNLLAIWIGAIIYSIFAILFGYVLFTNPPSLKG